MLSSGLSVQLPMLGARRGMTPRCLQVRLGPAATCCILHRDAWGATSNLDEASCCQPPAEIPPPTLMRSF